jgi:peptide/nickel transport system substrate-binding protein
MSRIWSGTPRRQGLCGTALAVATALSMTAMMPSPASATPTKPASTTRGTVLAIASGDVATTLNPGLSANDESDALYEELAYYPLIRLGDNQTLTPGLAVSWGYVGTGNKVFVLHLRSGVRFSNGQLMTADAVANSINYWRKANGPLAVYASAIKSVTATGPLTVKVVGSTPDPEYPLLFSRQLVAGDIIAPAGVANPKLLQNSTLGAGPYVYSPSQSVSGSYYTYLPNKYFFDQGAIHWGKVVIRVISNDTSTLAALQAGQVNFALIGSSTARSAGANLRVYTAPANFEGLYLADQQPGSPLANPLVREALNMAVNRPELATGVFGKFASPSDELAVPGYDGWVPSYAHHYIYNVAKAKALLAKAGYPNGFTLTVDSLDEFDMSTLTTAIAGELSAIGVTLKITVTTTVAQYVTDGLSQKFNAISMFYGGLPMYVVYQEILASDAGVFNPFKIQYPTFTALAAKGAALNTAARLQVWRQLQESIINQAIELPVLYNYETYVTTKGLTGFTIGSGNITPDPLTVAPAH